MTTATSPWSPREARTRDALMGALLPAPGRGLPALDALDLSAFWPAFHDAAPVHLRLGLRAACLVLGQAPRLMGFGRALPDLNADERDAFIVRAAASPALTDLVEVAKVVASLAYFSDDGVQAVARARGRREGAGS
jgi:hypothetical protein